MANIIEAIAFTSEKVAHVRQRQQHGIFLNHDLSVLGNLTTIQSQHLEETSRAVLENAQGLLDKLKKIQGRTTLK